MKRVLNKDGEFLFVSKASFPIYICVDQYPYLFRKRIYKVSGYGSNLDQDP